LFVLITAYPKVDILQQKRKEKGKGKKEEHPQAKLKQLHAHLLRKLLLFRRQQNMHKEDKKAADEYKGR
jgi:hypothetical protein